MNDIFFFFVFSVFFSRRRVGKGGAAQLLKLVRAFLFCRR